MNSSIAKLAACLALITASLFAYTLVPRERSVIARIEPGDLKVVSAASLRGPTLAAGSQASIFGFARGAIVSVQDSDGVSRIAPLQFVSPERIDFTIPAATKPGNAHVMLTSSSGERATAALEIEAVAPGIFTLDGSGAGFATTIAIRTSADGRRIPVLAFDCSGDAPCSAVAIDVAHGPVTVSFFGTGFRRRSSPASVTCKMAGLDAPVVFAGVQDSKAGTDRIDVVLPKGLAGRGDVTVVFTIDGRSTNPVSIRAQ